MFLKKSNIIEFNHKWFLFCGSLNICMFLVVNTFLLFDFSIGLLYIWCCLCP